MNRKAKQIVGKEEDYVEKPSFKESFEPKRKQAPVNINLGEEEESLTSEEAFAKAVMILAETKQPKVLSEIDDAEVRYTASLFAVALATKNKMLLSFLDNFLLLRVSYRRQGRKEILEIAKAKNQEPEQRLGRIRQFLGLR